MDDNLSCIPCLAGAEKSLLLRVLTCVTRFGSFPHIDLASNSSGAFVTCSPCVGLEHETDYVSSEVLRLHQFNPCILTWLCSRSVHVSTTLDSVSCMSKLWACLWKSTDFSCTAWGCCQHSTRVHWSSNGTAISCHCV